MLDRLDEVEELLNEIYEQIPKKYFSGLNGGVVIEENICYHPESVGHDLVCLGCYKKDLIGKTIIIYYGSFMDMYAYLSRQDLKEKLRETLYHELTHHLECLAGEFDLEIEDKKFIEKYKEKR